MKLSFLFLCSNALGAIATKLNHVGCFYNTSDMSILNKHTDDKMTISLCHEKCKQFNEDYIILSSGDTCLCGSSQFEPTDDCSMLCAGDDEQTCGGEKSVDIYRTNDRRNDDKQIDDSNEYMDCFSDDEEERVMDYFTVIENLTPAKCRLHCSSIRNSLYYALQHGKECFCGSSDVFSDYDKYGVGKCDVPCEGDSDETCGGFYAFDLYRFDDKSDKPCPKPVPVPSPTTLPTDKPTNVKPSDEPVSETVSMSTDREPEPEETVQPVSEPEPEPEPINGRKKDPKIDVEIGGELSSETESEEPESETETEEPESEATEEPESEPEVSTGDAGDFQELLDLHNSVRCAHGAEPLKWSADVQKSAQWYADKLSSEKCGKLEHSTSEQRNGYGENLYISGNTAGNSYSASGVVQGWYTDEVSPDNTDVKSFQNHATALLWKSTKFLGCGLAQCESDFKYDLVVCQYDPQGNLMSNLLQEVGPFTGGNC